MIKEKNNINRKTYGLSMLANPLVGINVDISIFIVKKIINPLTKKAFYLALVLALISLFIQIYLFFSILEGAIVLNKAILFKTGLFYFLIVYLGRHWIPYWEDKKETLVD